MLLALAYDCYRVFEEYMYKEELVLSRTRCGRNWTLEGEQMLVGSVCVDAC
jgi:hypothetical protein